MKVFRIKFYKFHPISRRIGSYDIPNAFSFVFGDAPIDISRKVRHYWNSVITIYETV